MSHPLQRAFEEVIREFPFDNYGMDEIEIALREDPESQEWVPALAKRIVNMVTHNATSVTSYDLDAYKEQ